MNNKQTEVSQVISEIREILRNLTPEQYERLKNSNVGLPIRQVTLQCARAHGGGIGGSTAPIPSGPKLHEIVYKKLK